jgi:hypothetical protein
VDMSPRRAKGTPLPPIERARARQLLRKLGEAGAAAALGVDRRTLARCLAGLPLYAGTRALVQQRLQKLA